MTGSKRIVWAIVLTLTAAIGAKGAEIDFSGLALTPNSYWNGSDDSGGFSVGGVTFPNEYEYFPDWGMESWAGWSYSNVTSTAAGYTNQYAASTGGGISGAGSNYAVAFVDSANGAIIDLGVHQAISLKLTNTAYAYHSMKEGDAFSRKFGPSDWFKLTIRGFAGTGATGASTGSIDFFLASGTSILNQWASVDLSSISPGARSLGFELTSSDNGDYGMNTPAYFALGSLTVAPEPGTVILSLIAAMTLTARLRKRA